ncbi:hypothetical protein BW12_09590 [Bifidobacterium sp. UTCIF-3]|nr:hypothetical protein BW09_08915 [Bifidobacterium sp. UTCIF-1]TPF81530.1 hypothetical protein BW12_09590 [Bifidobacterium sp. UTCIF-3]TPF84398.1 hypothetical protein BW07_04855 [Bifidobacterium sp. UTCIF-36]TPF88537.1 hypothetical protein BW10_09310 [Bifidobacterium sp. UTBIF-56]
MPLAVGFIVGLTVRFVIGLAITMLRMQHGLEHIDLPLQLIDETHLLRDEQVAQVGIALRLPGRWHDDGTPFRGDMEAGFVRSVDRRRRF